MTFFAGQDNKANDTSEAGDSNDFCLFCIFTKTLFCENTFKHAYSTVTNFVAVLGQYQENIVVDSGVDV